MLGIDIQRDAQGKLPDTVVFDGVPYRLVSKGRYYLSQSTTNEGRRGAKGLHVAIWERFSGQKVPKGYDVHHKDGNTFNNEFDNLECLSRSEHRKTVNLKTERVRKHLDDIRHLATDWHRSEEGREWHRKHSKQPKGCTKKCVCLCCGEEFLSKKSNAKFCSRKCETKYRYDNSPREERFCAVCGAKFTTFVGPYRRSAVTCSRKCSARLRSQKASGVQPDG